MMMVAKTLGFITISYNAHDLLDQIKKNAKQKLLSQKKKRVKHSQKKNEDGQKNNITKKKIKEKAIYIHT